MNDSNRRITQQEYDLQENAQKYMLRAKRQFEISSRNLLIMDNSKRDTKTVNEQLDKEDDEDGEIGAGIRGLSKIKEILPVQLTWLDLVYTVNPGKKKQKEILHNVSGSIESGRILAVMGPSGCGKTTLLNTLAGRLPKGGKLNGQILVNGLPITDGFRTLTAYVTQDDSLYATLTVEETLGVSVGLRTASTVSKADKGQIVDAVIQELGLAKARKTFVGNAFIRGVSGGERKRVNIGVEMIANPSVLFLDEPTSGLDSFQAQSVVTTMWNLARNGRTIVSVLHQPRSSIYKMFDQLILMSAGNTIFFGKAEEALDYFGHLGFQCPTNYNPSDFFMDIISVDNRSKDAQKTSQERVDLLVDSYKSYHDERNKTQLDISKRKITDSTINFEHKKFDKGLQDKTQENLNKKLKHQVNMFTQFATLFVREAKISGRDSKTYLFQFVSLQVLAILIGLTYLLIAKNKGQNKIQDTTGSIFVLSLQIAFNLVSTTISIFPSNRKFIDKERASKTYNLIPYMISLNCFEIPFKSAPSTLLAILLYLFYGLQRTPSKFFYFIGLTALYEALMVTFAFVVSCGFTSAQVGNSISTPILIIFSIFGGLYIAESSLPRGGAWVKYISPVRFYFYGIIYNEFDGQVGYSCSDQINRGGSCQSCIPDGNTHLSQLGILEVGNQFHTTTRGYAFVGLTYQFIFLQVLCYIILRFIAKPRFASLKQKKEEKKLA